MDSGVLYLFIPADFWAFQRHKRVGSQLWSGVGIARKGTRMEGAKIVMMKDEYEGINKDNWMKEALNRDAILATFFIFLPCAIYAP